MKKKAAVFAIAFLLSITVGAVAVMAQGGETTPGPTVEPPTVDTTGKIVVSDRYASEKGSDRFMSVYDPQTGAVSDYVNGVFQRQRATTPQERAFLQRQAKDERREDARNGLRGLKSRLEGKEPLNNAELAEGIRQILDLLEIQADQ